MIQRLADSIKLGLKFIFIAVKTCGVPTIKNVMRNLTVSPGDSAR